MIENTVYARLSTFPALTAVVGTRVYPTVPTEDTATPFVVFTVTGSEPPLHTNGVSVEIDAWGINLDTTLKVLDATKAALHGYRGGQIRQHQLRPPSPNDPAHRRGDW